MDAARAFAMDLAAVAMVAMALAAAATLAVALSTAAAPAFAADDENEPLPELGDSAERVLSPTQEKRIGDQFRRQLFRDPAYIADPEINAYLNRLGAQIAAHASLRGVPIAVHLVQNPQLNAFAVPGGHITFHTGLLLAAENEDELAAVMAHEIAHISQRHLPRMVAKMEASRLPAAAAILASIVVGGQAGLAGLTVANAALLSNQLAYTREFEREADAIGIRLLAESGYDPAAMGANSSSSAPKSARCTPPTRAPRSNISTGYSAARPARHRLTNATPRFTAWRWCSGNCGNSRPRGRPCNRCWTPGRPRHPPSRPPG